MSSNERWADALGYGGSYRISDQGRVLSLKRKNPRLLALKGRPDGYVQVTLMLDGRTHQRLVHTLVDEAFNGPPVCGLEVNHRDGIKSHNWLTNLERLTPSNNMKHAFAMGLKQPQAGEKNGRAVLDEVTVAAIRAKVGRISGRLPHGLCTRLAKEHGVSVGAMSHVLHGRHWKTKENQ